MKKYGILITLIVVILNVCVNNSQAQLGKIGKDLKKKASKTVKSTDSKVSVGGMSEECVQCTKDLENRTSSIEKKISEGNIKTVASSIENLPKYINRYKDAKCPGLEKWEAKKTELEVQFNLKLAEKFPQAVLIDGINKNSKEMVDVAIEKGADLNKRVGDISFQIYQELGVREYFDIDYNDYPLTIASRTKNMEMVKYLVSKGANPASEDFCSIILLNSVNNNDLEMTKFFLDKGANPQSADKSFTAPAGRTIEAQIVFTAAKNDNLDMIKEFEKHPNIDITVYQKGYNEPETGLESAPQGSKTFEYIKQKVLDRKKAKVNDPVNIEHAKHIVFSTEKIPEKGANSSKFGTKFQVLKNFYGRFYFGSLLSEYYYGETSLVPSYGEKTLTVYLKFNGKEYDISGRIYLTKDDDPTSFELNPNTREKRGPFHLLVRALKTGDNQVEICAYLDDKEEIAKESIILQKKAGDYYAMGKKFSDYKAGMKNPTIEAGILKAANAGSNGKNPYKAVKIQDTDWTIERNELTGRILRRTISAYCYSQSSSDGHCFVQSLVFEQEYNGSSYSNTFKYYTTGEGFGEIVDCN